MIETKKALVIFDLDETLIHSSQHRLEREPDFVIERLSVYFRPFARDLIDAVWRKFEIGVWSAGSPLYVDTIVKTIFPEAVKPLFVWNRDHCTKHFERSYFQALFLKDLNKTLDFGYTLANTLIIEDDPVKVRDFPTNAIIVKQYFGDNEDDELSNLARFIDGLNGHDNDFRDIGKDWREKL